MSEELTEIEFSLDDESNGLPLTPETVDLPTLRGFLEEVETFIKGDSAGATLSESRVRILAGSVKVVALVPRALAADAKADIERLEREGDLDSIQLKRAQVVETWQKRARRSPTRTYKIGRGQEGTVLRIAQDSRFQHGGENAWVVVEKYLSGRVVDLGGKQNPNVHLVLAESGRSERVSATEQQLADEKENQLYKDVTLRVQAEQHLRTKALRDIRLIEFVRQTSEIDERALEELWTKGRQAWKDVKSAADWVENLRGNV